MDDSSLAMDYETHAIKRLCCVERMLSKETEQQSSPSIQSILKDCLFDIGTVSDRLEYHLRGKVFDKAFIINFKKNLFFIKS